MGLDSVKMRAIALKMPAVPRVTMKGERPRVAIPKPFSEPIAAPERIPKAIHSTTPISYFMVPAMIMLLKARIEPIDRSIPAVPMTRVIPTAAMIGTADWTRILIRFSRVRK
jgi:hypothetical protein